MKHFPSLFQLVLILVSQLIFGQIPQGYYDSAENLSGQDLRAALHNIIDDHIEFSYGWDILKESDVDPNNSDNVILIYSRESVDANQEYNGGNGWNREHVWAKSWGGFSNSDTEGKDYHNLRASNIPLNGSKSNNYFDECSPNCTPSPKNNPSLQVFGNFLDETRDTFQPREEDRGDVARIIFYMDVRYEGDSGEEDLLVVDNIPSQTGLPQHGVLSTLLQWHEDDPVDDFERNRNDVIYSYQGNRNPFIDHPNLVDYLWGDQEQMNWTLSSELQSKNSNIVYPNPVYSGYINIKSDSNPNRIEIFDVHGKKIKTFKGASDRIKAPSNSGVYFLRFHFDQKVIHKKIIVGSI